MRFKYSPVVVFYQVDQRIADTLCMVIWKLQHDQDDFTEVERKLLDRINEAKMLKR